MKTIVKRSDTKESQAFGRRPVNNRSFSRPNLQKRVFPYWIIQFSKVDGRAEVFIAGDGKDGKVSRRNESSYSDLIPTNKLPDSFDPNAGEERPNELIGSRIIRFGGGPEGSDLEGGGLIIDYVPKNSDCTRRVVLEFMERGMWLSYSGPVHKSSSLGER